MLNQDIRIFAQCHLFDQMTEEDAVSAISLTHPTVAEFPAGSVIFSGREFSPSLIFVLSGTLTVERKEGGKRVLLNTIDVGGCFGAASMFGAEEEFPTRVTAKSDVRIAAIHEEGLTSLFMQYPQAALNHVRFLSGKIRFLNKKIAALTGRDTESKVSNYILRTYGKQTLHTKLNMAETSRKLDMGRASLYRIITRLHDAGIIHYHNGYIEILQIKELERLSQ